jgi:POT family proton-dependent oligopeptide transporter
MKQSVLVHSNAIDLEALRLRHRRDLYAPWHCHLSLRISLPAGAGGAPQVSIVGVPLVFWIWRRQALRRREPDDLAKIGIGAWITTASNLILVAAIIASGSAPVYPLWPFLYSTGLGISFLYYWPTLLALVSRAAPAKVNATLMGLAFMSLFISNNLIGWLGGFYEKMTPAQFWAMHAAIAAGGGLLVVLFGRRLSRTLYRSPQLSRRSLPS